MTFKSLFISAFVFLGILVTSSQVLAIDSIGTIEPPPGTAEYMAASGLDNSEIAIIFFISRIIRLIMIIAGGWATVMVLLSAYTFITSGGDSASYQKVRNQLTNAVVGLFLIMITYTITGVISLLIFGDAGFILNPTIEPLIAPI